ncbi:hypothetical protein BDR26DRAFT_862475, partial [Obelidium mucronatum]
MIGGVVPLATLAEDAAEFESAFESAFEGGGAPAAYGGETRWNSDGEDESESDGGGGGEEGPDEEREAEREAGQQIEGTPQLHQEQEVDAHLTQTPIEQETEEQSQTGGRLWTAILELGRSHTTKHSQSTANDKTHQFAVRSSSLNNSAPRLRSSSSTETLRNEENASEIPHFQHTPSVTHDSVTQSIQIPSHSTRTRFRPFSSPPAFQLSGTSNLSPSLSSSNRAPSPHLPPHFEESLLLSSKTRTGSKPSVFSNPFRRISLHKRSQTTYLRKPDSRFSLDIDETGVKPDLELRSQSYDTTTAAATTTRQPVIIHRASADTIGSSLTITDSEDAMETAATSPSNAKQQQEPTKGIKKLLQKTSAFFKLSVSSSSSSTAAPVGSLPTNGTPSKAHPRFPKRSKPTTPLDPNPLTKFGSLLTKSSTLSSSQPRADTAAAAAAAAAPVPSNELVLPPPVLTTEHLKSQEMTSTYSINVRRSSLLSNITHRVGTRTNSTTNRPAANKINNHENTIDLLAKAKDLPPTTSTPSAAHAAAVTTNRTTTTALTVLASSHNNQNNGDTSGINIELPAFSECSQEDVLDGIGSAADLRRVNTYAEEPIG